MHRTDDDDDTPSLYGHVMSMRTGDHGEGTDHGVDLLFRRFASELRRRASFSRHSRNVLTQACRKMGVHTGHSPRKKDILERLHKALHSRRAKKQKADKRDTTEEQEGGNDSSTRRRKKKKHKEDETNNGTTENSEEELEGEQEEETEIQEEQEEKEAEEEVEADAESDQEECVPKLQPISDQELADFRSVIEGIERKNTRTPEERRLERLLTNTKSASWPQEGVPWTFENQTYVDDDLYLTDDEDQPNNQTHQIKEGYLSDLPIRVFMEQLYRQLQLKHKIAPENVQMLERSDRTAMVNKAKNFLKEMLDYLEVEACERLDMPAEKKSLANQAHQT